MRKRFTLDFYTYRMHKVRPGFLVNGFGSGFIFSAGIFRRAFAVTVERGGNA